MKYILKSIIALYIIASFFITKKIETLELVLLFALLSITIFVDTKSKPMLITMMTIESILVALIGLYTDYIIFALMILMFDILLTRTYYMGIILVAEFIYFKCYLLNVELFLSLALVAFIGYIISQNDKSKKEYLEALDKERQTKYELEITKANLISQSNELQKLAKENERNRIARDLHDNIGHKIAGVLINLQATNKVLEKDTDKGRDMLAGCISHLQSSLETIRETVHNMYSYATTDINYLKQIIDEYKYCPIEFSSEGNLDTCSQKHIVVFSYVLKEALTNIAKHSIATKVTVFLSCIDNMATMEIKDNGIGCNEIVESLGIKSMRDRMKSIGGTFIMDGKDGMKITCIVTQR